MSFAAATNEGGATSKGRSGQDIRGLVTAGLRQKNNDRNLLRLTVETPRDPLANERVNLAEKYAKSAGGAPDRCHAKKTASKSTPDEPASRCSCSKARARVGPMLPIGMDNSELISR